MNDINKDYESFIILDYWPMEDISLIIRLSYWLSVSLVSTTFMYIVSAFFVLLVIKFDYTIFILE